MALGIVNCRVRNECDPALALLADFVKGKSHVLQTGAVFGLGLAYVGTCRNDVLDLLIPTIQQSNSAELIAVSSLCKSNLKCDVILIVRVTILACGLVALGSCNGAVSTAIINKLVDLKDSDVIKSSHMNLAVLGLGLCYIGRKDCAETSCETLEVFDEPFCSTSKIILNFCAYVGTGDVFMIQELLGNCGDRPSTTEVKKEEKPKNEQESKEKKKTKLEWDPHIAQAVAVLGLGAVALGEEMGQDMCQRLLGSVGRYGDPIVRRAVPLAVALLSASRPELTVIDLLTKYSHDSDEKVACNAIFALGIVGAGTNNARLAAGLRQLAVYHSRNPSQLFMVRLAQGLTALGKGTLTLNPLHADRQLVDPCAVAGNNNMHTVTDKTEGIFY